jgi:2-phosphosulfolactate phosphatase
MEEREKPLSAVGSRLSATAHGRAPSAESRERARTRQLRVLTTREEVVPERLVGVTAVVLDVLLATTTLLTILENGARGVFPAGSLEEARRVCDGMDAAGLIRGGEQNAVIVDGFDCGPMPDEYPPDRVRGKDVVYVSTNGTRAISRAAGADRLLVASLRNAPAVARHLDATAPALVCIVCAGSRGRFSLEDFVGAGVLLSHMDAEAWQLDDAAWLALDTARRHRDRLPALLGEGRAGRWVVEHDLPALLEYVGSVGASDVLAEVRGGELVRIAARDGAR